MPLERNECASLFLSCISICISCQLSCSCSSRLNSRFPNIAALSLLRLVTAFSQTYSERLQDYDIPPLPAEHVDLLAKQHAPSKPVVELRIPTSTAHSRESSLSRLTSVADAASALSPDGQTHQTLLHSPRFQASQNSAVKAGAASLESQLELRSPTSYGHHRQTSIVHGYQRSRDGSFPSSSSPLSPQIIAAAGGESLDSKSNMARTEDGAPASATPSMTGSSTFSSSSSTLMPERVAAPPDHNIPNAVGHKKMERMHSGKSRREAGHGHSHSRHHHREEVKSVAEYALHVLFTSVSIYIPRCTDCPKIVIVYCPSRGKDQPMCQYTTRSRAAD